MLNLRTMKISIRKSMRFGRSNHSAIFHKNRVFVFGGFLLGSKEYTAHCEVYDLELDRWTVIQSMNQRRKDFGTCILPNEWAQKQHTCVRRV